MTAAKTPCRVLVVSESDKVYDYVTDILPPGEFSFAKAASAGEAKRMSVSDPADILLINTPLPDEFGTDLALDLSEGNTGILLLVRSEYYEEVLDKTEKEGILTLSKPLSRQSLCSVLHLLTAMCAKLKKLEKKNRTLQEKMADIRTVNRAKWLLIENLNMTEKDAHYYIEKQAMDTRLSRKEIAENIIRTYDK